MRNDDISAAAFHRFISQLASGRSSALPLLAAFLVLSLILVKLHLHSLFFRPTASNNTMAMNMSITAMCNINMIYLIVAVLVCVFVSDDFKSGFSKNLFTVRAKKTDYVISKTIVCIVGGAFMIIAFFLGSLLGGAISGLPFDMVGFGVNEMVMCILSKVLLVSVFVPIYIVMSVVAKQKLWLSLIISLMAGMFLFMMIPMLTPLNSTIINVMLCIAGGTLFSAGLGIVSTKILEKSSLV